MTTPAVYLQPLLVILILTKNCSGPDKYIKDKETLNIDQFKEAKKCLRSFAFSDKDSTYYKFKKYRTLQ